MAHETVVPRLLTVKQLAQLTGLIRGSSVRARPPP
jgi:hypothetical protein